MDAASILVLILCVGGLALLVWFEMNSRAHTAKKNQNSSTAQPEMGAIGNQATTIAESQASKKKAA
jgi:hypothetical protein